MKAVAIIPARGGSKRIPKKNIRAFASKPMIAHPIGRAIESGLFDRIIVSTDSQEIADVALSAGAEVPFLRPPELSDDFAGTDAVVLHSLDWLKSRRELPEFFCCIYPTSPLLLAADLAAGLRELERSGAGTAFSVADFAYPILRALRLNDRGRLEMIWPEHFSSRSQDLPASYHDAGQFYWARTARYLAEGRFFGADAVPIILPRSRVADIDNEEDWRVAEALYSAQHNIGGEES